MGEIAACIVDKLKREEFSSSVSSVPCCSALCETLFVDNAIEKQATRQVLRSMIFFIATYIYFQFIAQNLANGLLFLFSPAGSPFSFSIAWLSFVSILLRRRGERSILLASIIALGSPPRTSHTKIAVYSIHTNKGDESKNGPDALISHQRIAILHLQ